MMRSISTMDSQSAFVIDTAVHRELDKEIAYLCSTVDQVSHLSHYSGPDERMW